MKTIETEVTITAEGQLVAHIATAEVPPGHYRAVVVLEAQSIAEDEIEDFPVIDVGPWPENLSLRREDLYGEDER